MVPTANLLLVTRRAKRNGKFPVKIRVIYQRNYKDFPLGVDLNEIEFEGATSKNIKKEYRRVAIKLNSEVAKYPSGQLHPIKSGNNHYDKSCQLCGRRSAILLIG